MVEKRRRPVDGKWYDVEVRDNAFVAWLDGQHVTGNRLPANASPNTISDVEAENLFIDQFIREAVRKAP